MQFAKLEALGNDFIVMQAAGPPEAEALAGQAARLCDRRRGIGADGLIVALPPTQGGADWGMRIFNADGSEAEMCGNGVRCLALYLRRSGLAPDESLTVETLAGPIRVAWQGEQMRVEMGRPVLEAAEVPTAQRTGRVILREICVEDRAFAVTAVSMGPPHAVIYAEELSDALVLGYGSKLEGHPFFPRRTNVDFVRVIAEGEIEMRVYERGCGETPACGTGACAAVVAGVLTGRSGHRVTVHLPGGDLEVAWDGDPQHSVYLTGPARWVFAGEMAVP